MNKNVNETEEPSELISPDPLAKPEHLPPLNLKRTHYKRTSILEANPPPKPAGNQILPMNLKKTLFKQPAADEEGVSQVKSIDDMSFQKPRAKPSVSKHWALVKSKVDDIVMIKQLNREMEKSTFSGKKASKIERFECSIYHEGKIMDVIVLMRAVSVALILILLPLE